MIALLKTLKTHNALIIRIYDTNNLK